MNEHVLHNCRVLLVEDEFFLMEELSVVLRHAGADVLGPAGTLADMLRILDAEPAIDGAVLDVNLRGQSVFEGADILLAREIPFVFATGYDADQIPERFRHVPRCQKPIDLAAVTHAIAEVIGARGMPTRRDL